MTATATRERPILFSGPMVRAILDGRKTQTRRLIFKDDSPNHMPWKCGDRWQDGDLHLRCPYEVGMRLWVRSGWSISYHEDRELSWWIGPEGCGLAFQTHGKPQKPKRLGEQPSIHMPRWVAQSLRLPELEITKVRAERLQSIPHYDIRAEGCECPTHDFPGGMCVSECRSLRSEFVDLWDGITSEHPYKSNPWVWVVSFERLEGER